MTETTTFWAPRRLTTTGRASSYTATTAMHENVGGQVGETWVSQNPEIIPPYCVAEALVGW